MSRRPKKEAPKPVGQPVAYASGENERPYGERKQLENAQKSIPLPVAGQNVPAPPPGPDPGVAAVLSEGVFGGTRRPEEPITAGVDVGPGPGRETPVLPNDPNMVLRALIAAGYDHPDLVRLLNG